MSTKPLHYSGSTRKRVLRDWLEYIPKFRIVKGTQLGYMAGPLLVGVCLDRTSTPSEYRPIGFCSNTGYNGFVEALGFPFRLSPPVDSHVSIINVKFHEVHYREAADLMVRHYPPLRITEHSYEAYKEALLLLLRSGVSTLHTAFCEFVVFVAWKEGKDAALRYLEHDWRDCLPADRIDSTIIETIHETRYTKTLELISDVPALRDRVETFIVENSLTHLPRYEI